MQSPAADWKSHEKGSKAPVSCELWRRSKSLTEEFTYKCDDVVHAPNTDIELNRPFNCCVAFFFTPPKQNSYFSRRGVTVRHTPNQGWPDWGPGA
jgi:hypothetical protein